MQLIKAEVFKGDFLEKLRELVLTLKAEDPILDQGEVVEVAFREGEERLEVMLLFQT